MKLTPEEFSEFWRSVNEMRKIRGHRPLTRDEIELAYDTLVAFHECWNRPPE